MTYADIIGFLGAHPKPVLTLHLIGVILGMGGASVADMLFFTFLKDFKISHKEAEVMKTVSNLIMGALVLIYISGIALYLPRAAQFNASPAFLAKAAIVIIITLNGVLMHKLVAPSMIELSFRRTHTAPCGLVNRLRKAAFAMGSVSIISWYSVFLIAMLKSYFPSWVATVHILGIYGAILAIGMCCSQIVESRMMLKSGSCAR